MTRWIAVGYGGLLDAERVVAAVRARSAPVKRLLDAAGPDQIINLTYGYPRKSVVLLDTGHLALLPLAFDDLLRLLNSEETNDDV
ncbi:MAG: DUF370 domain-containing protein [Chloroflexi bacterium]|nr:DUF370 domain-containing protein [Chloroflexota bacterium]